MKYKINEIFNSFLLAGDKIMPEMHLGQPVSLENSGFTYSASGPFTKNQRNRRFTIYLSKGTR